MSLLLKFSLKLFLAELIFSIVIAAVSKEMVWYLLGHNGYPINS